MRWRAAGYSRPHVESWLAQARLAPPAHPQRMVGGRGGGVWDPGVGGGAGGTNLTWVNQGSMFG